MMYISVKLFLSHQHFSFLLENQNYLKSSNLLSCSESSNRPVSGVVMDPDLFFLFSGGL